MTQSNYIETIKKALAQLEENARSGGEEMPTIGIGITTASRPNGVAVFTKTLSEIVKHRPPCSTIVVVNDAGESSLGDIFSNTSTCPQDTYYRFNDNVGIARAKNKCFELLQNCQHIFLFDDDTFPLIPEWYLPYCNSQENHLMYTFCNFANGTPCGDIKILYKDDRITAYSHVRGCMLYYKRACLEKVGGMDPVFGKWGNEHGDLSNRIFSAGLTTFRYMDISNSKGYFYSGDEHVTVTSTFVGSRRTDSLDATIHIYERQRNTALYREYRDKVPAVVSTYYTQVKDPQRGLNWSFSPDQVAVLSASVTGKHVQAVLLHDLAEIPEKARNMFEYVYVGKPALNPYLQRWVNYYQYLREHKNNISWVFLVDATDVELINLPKPVPGKLYVGSENERVGCAWLKDNHTDAVLQRFILDYGDMQLLNAGVVGGYVDDVIEFVKRIVDCIADLLTGQFAHKQPGPGLTDMALFNMVAYTQFAHKIITGTSVTTEFKANARNNYSWFKHK